MQDPVACPLPDSLYADGEAHKAEKRPERGLRVFKYTVFGDGFVDNLSGPVVVAVEDR